MDKKERILQHLFLLYAVGTVFVFCFEMLWGDYSRLLYSAAGLSGSLILMFFFFSKKAYRQVDTWLIIIFFAWCAVSVFFNYGFSLGLLASRSFFVWIYLFALYYLVLYDRDSYFALKCTLYSMMAGLTVVNLLVLFYATDSLCHVREVNLMLGCFRVGRLTGVGNANSMGICSCILAILALFGLLTDKKKLLRVLFVGILCLSIFNMGLTNCRTAIVGFAVSVGLLFFSKLYRSAWLQRDGGGFTMRKLSAWAAAIFSALAVMAIAIGVCYLPVYLYRAVLQEYGRWTHNEYLLQSLGTVFLRSIGSDVETLTDRTLIWKKVIEDTFCKPRLILFGISNRSETPIYGVYAGKHEIVTVHGHNIYIDALRRNGIPGLMIVIAMTIYWLQKSIAFFFDRTKKIPEVYLATVVFTSLLMGLMELIPFSFFNTHFYSIPFYIVCGYLVCMRRRAL